MITLTAVRPPARFGAIKVNGNYVKFFREKNLLDSGWINGGFFVIEPKFLNLIKNDQTFLEQSPFKKATKMRQMMAFKHHGFWQCMDTLRDKEILEKKLEIKSILSKKILITGGTGFIGYHLAKKCLELNWSVTSLSSKNQKDLEN